MERRFLPALSDPSGEKGAYASRWEGGWKDVATSFAIRFEKKFQIGSFEDTLEKLEDRCGCYAVLYQPDGLGENHGYVAYVGYSKQLATEVQTVVKRWHQAGYLESPTSRKFVYTACYIQNDHHAREYEYMLIRYYAPPWNTRFAKQPRRPGKLVRTADDAEAPGAAIDSRGVDTGTTEVTPPSTFPVQPSTALAAIVGPGTMTRGEMTQRLWAYIKSRCRPDRRNVQKFIPDAALKRVLGNKTRFTYLEIGPLVERHLSPA